MSAGGRGGDGLTGYELSALLGLLAALLNDPDTLETSGLTAPEKNAVHRAYDKLWRRAHSDGPGTRRPAP